jgi:hypothetical protein
VETQTLSVRKYRAGYELRKEIWRMNGFETPITAAYTPSGDYIGDSRLAYQMVVKRGIAPEKAKSNHCVCSIGFCAREQKWYGWSHRAICGFVVGDMLFEEEAPGCTDETPFVLHGVKKIETLADAKQAAINFAASVS